MSFQSTSDTWTPTYGTSGPRAGFWQRFVADLIDVILLIIIAAIADAVLNSAGDVLAFLIWLAYFTGFEGGVDGQTPGKRAMRIRVSSLEDGQPIGYQRAFVRTLARIVSEIPFFLGYLWMLWNPQRQTWHDIIANAVVVPVATEPRRPPAGW